MRRCCCFFRGIPSRTLRRGKFVVWCGNTGLRRQRKSVHKEGGGEGSFWACTPLRWSANPTAELSCFSGPPRWNRTSSLNLYWAAARRDKNQNWPSWSSNRRCQPSVTSEPGDCALGERPIGAASESACPDLDYWGNCLILVTR